MNRRTLLAGLTSAPAGLLGAAALSTRGVSAQGTLQPIRIASFPTDAYAQPYFGDAAGIFKANGFAVDIQTLPNGNAMASALAGGAVDVAMASTLTIALGRENGVPFYCFAPGNVFTSKAPTAEVLVPVDSPLKTGADLNGKTIAVVLLKSLPQLGIDAWMRKNGGDPATVKYVEMPYSSMLVALEGKHVDAAWISEPVLTQARQRFKLFADTDAAIGEAWYVVVWFSTKSWLDQNTALAHRFAQAIAKTSAWANVHHAETAVMLEGLTKIPPEVVATMHRANFAEKWDPNLMDPPLQTAYRGGLLKAPITGKDLAYPGF